MIFLSAKLRDVLFICFICCFRRRGNADERLERVGEAVGAGFHPRPFIGLEPGRPAGGRPLRLSQEGECRRKSWRKADAKPLPFPAKEPDTSLTQQTSFTNLRRAVDSLYDPVYNKHALASGCSSMAEP